MNGMCLIDEMCCKHRFLTVFLKGYIIFNKRLVIFAMIRHVVDCVLSVMFTQVTGEADLQVHGRDSSCKIHVQVTLGHINS
jgi:hypothetical protein